MKILILTGKFGMGHYSASQSLRLQLLGAFPGGFTSAAGGICAAVFFGFLVALVCKPRDKSA